MRRLLIALAVVGGIMGSPFTVGAQVISPPGTVNITTSGSACTTAGACAEFPLANQPSATISISGVSFTATLQFEGTADNRNWGAISVIDVATGLSATSTTSAGRYAISNSGLLAVRVRASAHSAGVVVVSATRGWSSGGRPVNGGGVGNQFFQVAGPATTVKTYTFQNASSTVPSYIPGTSGLTVTVGSLANDAQGLTASATMGSVPTATLGVWTFTTTGAGSASQVVRGVSSVLAAGYTGSSNTAALYSSNATVGTGVNHGVDTVANGSGAALNVGINASGISGTKNIGVFGTSAGVSPTTTTVPFTGSVGGIAVVAANGTNTDDLIVAVDGTTTPLEVFRVKNAGDVSFASETGDTTLSTTWTATSGGGAVELLMTSGTSAAFGSTNNIPLNIKANAVSNWSFSTAGNFDLLVAGVGIRTAMIVEANTGTKTPTALESNEHYTNTGDGDGSAVTLLNDPTVGTEYTVTVTVAQNITITPNTGETLYFGSSTCNTSLVSNTIGSSVTIYAATGGSGALWISKAAMGTWVCTP